MLWKSLPFLVCLLSIVANVSTADEQATAKKDEKFIVDKGQIDPEVHAYLTEVMPLFFALGEGDVEKAGDILQKHLYFPEDSENVYGGFRASIDAQVLRFKQWKLDFESIELVQYKRFSKQSYSLFLIANGKNGPTLFNIIAFRHNDNWRIGTFHFNVNHAQFGQFVPNIVMAKPLSFQPVLQTAKKPETPQESEESDVEKR